MRTLLPGILLAFLAVGGCGTTRYEIAPASAASPEDAFAMIRAALITDRPEILYGRLSPGFKERYRIPGIREWVAGHRMHRDDRDFKRLKGVFEKATPADVRIFHILDRDGRQTPFRAATLVIRAGDLTGELVFVEMPTITARAEIPDYDPISVDRYPGSAWMDWHELLEVRDGDLSFTRPVRLGDTGILTASELRELKFHYQWLLEDVRRPDIRALLERISGTGVEP